MSSVSFYSPVVTPLTSEFFSLPTSFYFFSPAHLFLNARMQKKALLRTDIHAHTSHPLPEAIFSFANDLTLPSANFTDQ